MKLEGLAPFRVTLWMSGDGLLDLVHTAFNLQEGICRPGL